MSLARPIRRYRPQPKVRVVLTAGDSSVVGRGSSVRGVEDIDLLPRVWQYTVSTAIYAQHTIINHITPLHHPDGIVPTSDRIGPGEELLRTLARRYPNDIILGVPCGAGGTGLCNSGNTWEPHGLTIAGINNGSHTNYDQMVAMCTAAMAAAAAQWPNFQIVHEMVYWNLGPNDVTVSVAGTEFLSNLTDLINTFRTTSQPSWANVRWVLAGLTPTDISVATGQQIERALLLAVASIANVYYVKGIADETVDGDNIHADPGANRRIGRAAALIDLDATPPVWPGLASYANAAGKKLQLDFAGDFAVVGSITSSVIAVDANFEIGNIFSANRTLRWNADGTKAAGGPFTASFTIMGGNRQTAIVSTSVTVYAAGGVNLGSLVPSGTYGFSFDPARQTTADQSQDDTPGTTAVALNSVVGRIVDDSPNAIVLKQATSANKPLLKQDSSVWNWTGDGTDDVLSGAISGGFGATAKGTVVLLMQSSQSATSKNIVAEGASSGSAIMNPLRSDNTTGTSANEFFRNDVSGSISGVAVASVHDGTWKVVTVQFDLTGGSGLVQVRVNGGAWSTANTGTLSGITVNRLALFAFQGASVNSWWAGKIGGVWGYADAVREGLLAIAEQNYAARAGITLS